MTDLTHDEYKKLYMKKMEAIEVLKNLISQYPELFNTDFLIKLLKDEYDREKDKLPVEIKKLIENISTKNKH